MNEPVAIHDDPVYALVYAFMHVSQSVRSVWYGTWFGWYRATRLIETNLGTP